MLLAASASAAASAAEEGQRIDWEKGTIGGKHPLADRVEALRRKFSGDIPYAAWPDVQRVWKLAASFQETVQRGALERLLDETIFAWREQTELPILGKKSITKAKRKELDRIALRLFEDYHLLQALEEKKPGGAVPAGSDTQRRILRDVQAPYLWLASLIEVEIVRRGKYPEFPTLGDFSKALLWGVGIGTAIGVAYIGYRVGRAF